MSWLSGLCLATAATAVESEAAEVRQAYAGDAIGNDTLMNRWC